MKYETRTRMVKKGTKCYVSEMGHYNFYYPDTDKQCKFASDAIINKLPWALYQGLQAVRVASGFVESNCEANGKSNIVWISPNTIHIY
jgi:hypothetical protein